MKAIIVTDFGSTEVMKYQDVALPVMNANQVLICVKATSVNYADIKARYGNYRATSLPFIPGIDAAGIVEAVGSDVMELKVGQRVIAFPKNGSYSEYIVADENLTFVIPDNLDFTTAAACPIVSFTSHKLLKDVARLVEGETVLIHAAAGGVGTTAIQIAKILGASLVIGTVGNRSKFEVALEAGADHVFSYEEDDFVKQVNQLTNGKGVDVILDSVSGPISEASLNCLAMYGRLITFGNSSDKIAKFKTNQLHASCRSIMGFSLGTTRNNRPELLQSTAKEVLAFLADNRLKIHIGKTFPLREAAQAQHLVESRQSTGKVLLKVED